MNRTKSLTRMNCISMLAAAVLSSIAYPSTTFGLMTSDVEGSQIVVPGIPAFGIDTDGVARLSIEFNNIPFFACTGTLLEGGEYVLTAAHCLDPAPGDGLFQITHIEWFVGNGDGSFGTVTADNIDPGAVIFHDWFVHNVDDPDALSGYDVALIKLPSKKEGVPTYQIHRGGITTVVNKFQVRVGYGLTGLGDGPPNGNLGIGTRRAGLNEWDEEAKDKDDLPLDGYEFVTGQELQRTQSMLLYDFDSGLPQNDVFSQISLWDDANPDLGWGPDEVSLAGGDSGGPIFILDSVGTGKVAGVMSWTKRIEDSDGSPDFDQVETGLGESWVATHGWVPPMYHLMLVEKRSPIGSIRSQEPGQVSRSSPAGLGRLPAIGHSASRLPRRRTSILIVR